MSDTLNHMPSDVVRELILDLGLGTEPSDAGDWPVYAPEIADEVGTDDVLQVKDTDGRQFGRIQVDGNVPENYGIQVLARSLDAHDGQYQLRKIQEAFSTEVLRTSVTVPARTLNDGTAVPTTVYRVDSIERSGSIRNAGRDGRRFLQTANFLVFLTQVSESTGT